VALIHAFVFGKKRIEPASSFAPALYVPMPACALLVYDGTGKRVLRTLVVMKLIHSVPFQHLVDLHDVRVGSVGLKLVGSAIETQHQAAVLFGVRRCAFLIICHRHCRWNCEAWHCREEEEDEDDILGSG
jgi:hypothetical protein